ncbi:MAG TPA: hypothetical protein VJT72_20010 [Pseudonocardiaceae bacterium]|nr:hypothetical protein [Pseudonocardiaceae bacterium]
MTVSLLDRRVYGLPDVDRLLVLPSGTLAGGSMATTVAGCTIRRLFEPNAPVMRK